MRLIHNMTTIAECPAPENSPLGRVIKMAVIGGSGVGKTGKTKNKRKLRWWRAFLYVLAFAHGNVFLSFLQRWW